MILSWASRTHGEQRESGGSWRRSQKDGGGGGQEGPGNLAPFVGNCVGMGRGVIYLVICIHIKPQMAQPEAAESGSSQATPWAAEWPWVSETQSLGLSFPGYEMELLPPAVAHPLHADLSQGEGGLYHRTEATPPGAQGDPPSSSFKGRSRGAGELAERTRSLAGGTAPPSLHPASGLRNRILPPRPLPWL